MALPFFPVERAFLIGCWLDAAFWGIFTLLFGTSLYMIWTRKKDHLLRIPALAMILMWLLATSKLFISFVRMLHAYTTTDHSGALIANPRHYLQFTVDGLFRGQEILSCLTVALIDMIIVWRCVKIWSNLWWYTLPPILSLLGALGAFIGVIHQYTFLTTRANLLKWCDYSFAFSLATVVMATTLTASRIWFLACKRRHGFQRLTSRYRLLILLIIESGGITCVQQIVEFTLCRLNDPLNPTPPYNAYFVIHQMAPQIMGISHALIVAVVVSGILRADNPIPYDSKSTSGNSFRAIYRLGARQPNLSNRRESGLTSNDMDHSANSATHLKIIPLSSLEKGRSDTDLSAEVGLTSIGKEIVDSGSHFSHAI